MKCSTWVKWLVDDLYRKVVYGNHFPIDFEGVKLVCGALVHVQTKSVHCVKWFVTGLKCPAWRGLYMPSQASHQVHTLQNPSTACINLQIIVDIFWDQQALSKNKCTSLSYTAADQSDLTSTTCLAIQCYTISVVVQKHTKMYSYMGWQEGTWHSLVSVKVVISGHTIKYNQVNNFKFLKLCQ